jgi:osmotically-inducible protein OsmY
MSVETEIRQAIIDELTRQADNSGSRLRVQATDDQVTINGPVNLDDLVMVVMGSVAGGP